jgi:malonyl-CoA O-methyltransferase
MVNKAMMNRNFSRNARFYDRYTAIQSGCAAKILEIIPSIPYENILEIGCGTGTFTELLSNKYPSSRITSIDVSAEMVEVAKEKIGLGNVKFIVADAEDASFEGKFDLIASNASFQWFEDIAGALVAYTNLLKPEGDICFTAYGPETYHELNEVLSIALGDGDWLSARTFASFERVKRALEGNYSGCYSEEKKYKETFGSLLEFFRAVKFSGARGDGFIRKIYLGKVLMKKLEDIYIKKYGDISVTHQVFYCRGRKK